MGRAILAVIASYVVMAVAALNPVIGIVGVLLGGRGATKKAPS